MGYRNTLTNATYNNEEAAEYNFTYVTKDEVINILDEIEFRVDDIKDALEGIKGLSEIDDVKELLKSLSNDLY